MKKSVYGLQGKGGLVDTIIELTEKGCKVCIHATHSAGLGTYIIGYEGDYEEEAPVIEEKKVDTLDMDKARGFKEDHDNNTAKEKLKSYAQVFGYELDPKRSFANMVKELEALQEPSTEES